MGNKKAKKYKKQPREENEYPEIKLSDLEKGFHHEIIRLFSDISKPFNNGKGEKEKVILDILAPYNAVYEEKIGIRIPSIKETPDIVVVSHIDLISTFNKGFAKDKIYSLGRTPDKGDIIIGALDNTITNAVVMLSLIKLREEGLAQNVEFLFTEGEEIDLLGMKAYLKKYGNKPFFINLDVTNDNQDKHISLEYDEPSWKISKQIKKLSKNNDFTVGFTKERVGDDTDAVLEAKGKGFSYCLPTWKTIHSYKNYTLIKNLVPYYEGLNSLLTELDVSDCSYDMVYSSFKKALKCKKKKEFEALEVIAKKEYDETRKSYSGYGKGNYYGGYTSHTGYHGRLPDYSTHSKSKGDPWQKNFDVVDNIPDSSGRLFFDYRDGALTEEEMLIQLSKDYSLNEDNVDDDFKGDFGDLELREKYKYIVSALADYDIEINPEGEKFFKENLETRSQWSIDDLSYAIGSIDISCKIIEALDDYYIIKEVDKDSGVYFFA